MDQSNLLLNKVLPIIETLKGFKETKAIGVYGSVGAGWADKWSDDIDIVCFCSDIPDYEKRQKMLKVLGAIPNKCWGTADLFKFKNIGSCGINYKKYRGMDSTIKKLVYNSEDWFEKDTAVFLNNIKVLYDPKGIIKKWKRLLTKYPKQLREHNMERVSIVLSGFEQIRKGLQRKNWLAVDMGIQVCIDNLIVPFYALNRKYFSTTKWFFKEAEEFRIVPKDFLPLMKRIVSLNNRNEISVKCELIMKAFKLLYVICKRENPKLTVRSIKEADENLREIKRLSK